MEKHDDKRLLTTAELCRETGLSKWTIYRLVKNGQLNPIVGLAGARNWYWRLSDLEPVLERL